jgi:hypothetical protein
MGFFVTEEKVISHAQYLDLVYSQTSMLYDLICDSPRPSTNPNPMPPIDSHDVDGVIGTFHAETQSKQSIHSNLKSTTTNVQKYTPLTPFPGKTSEVNTIQSTPTGKNKNKNKGKGKNKEDKNNNQQSDKPKTQPADNKERKNLVILVLSMVRIIIRKIVRDMLRLLSSCKGPIQLLHLSFCHNLFLLNSRPNWSIMTNLLPLPHLMYLCVLVTPRRMKCQSLLEPKIILLLKRKLMILHWFNLLHRLHLPTTLFISND